jgi:hypothetical protein
LQIWGTDEITKAVVFLPSDDSNSFQSIHTELAKLYSQSFAEVDSAGKIEGLRFPFGEKKTFTEQAPCRFAVARVNLLDSGIPDLKGHDFDRNFNVHGEVHAAHRFFVYPDFKVGFVGGCDFVLD